MKRPIALLGLLGLGFVTIAAQTFPLQVKNDSIIYTTDKQGNRLLDFSSCGYLASEAPIPFLENKVYVTWQAGNNSSRIQEAIDYLSQRKPDSNGFRGAILLGEGTFELEESLWLHTSGVVIRGLGREKTTLIKKGVDRGALIYIEGINDCIHGDTVNITTPYLPLNKCTFQVAQSNQLRLGDRIQITRPASKEWIASIGCDIYGGGISSLGWKPEDTQLVWDRTIVAIEGNNVTIDAPITVALDAAWGNAFITPYQWKGRIESCGIEYLTLVSDYNHHYPKDEDHCWTGVSIDRAENCWVRAVNFKHFAGSAVILQPTASKTTVEDCISTQPISEIGGMRRQTFLTLGQQNLFQRCYSEQGINDFAAGYVAAGPNAFVQCDSYESLGFSGSVGSWAPGLLFDVVNIDGNNLSFKNLGQDKNGTGWNTANSLFWQCTAAEIECYSPAMDATNSAYGCWAQFSGNGNWGESNNHVHPRSLFYGQLAQRVKRVTVDARIMPLSTTSTSSPTVDQAAKLAKESLEPRITLAQWIKENPLPQTLTTAEIPTLEYVSKLAKKRKKQVTSIKEEHYAVVNGKLTWNNALLVGGKSDVQWWAGNLKNTYLPKTKIHLTRFVPGREGMGLTDRIDSVIHFMKANQLLAIDHNYGLWYDRRRDDHQRIRRRDGDVWAPFYEQPFARSGEGTAWEGLSKYDLTRPNAWYWNRLQTYTQKGAKEGLLLYHQHYFQHNILEAGAHWVDAPWRSANNINQTDFLEPVNFSGDKRIFVADAFYDVTHPVRRELHRNYIRQCLDAFANSPNAVQYISHEFTGPLHFVQFWLDVISEWQTEKGKDAMVALSVTKDVQDAILADPVRSKIVDIIDIRYWHYKSDGIFAPNGGENMAPRQHMRKVKVGKTGYDETYKAVREYRKKYPKKAVTFYAQSYPSLGWAVLMAGGSAPVLPIKEVSFLTDVVQMEVEEVNETGYQKIGNSGIGCIIYSQSNEEKTISLPSGKYTIYTINPQTGELTTIHKSLIIKELYTIKESKKNNQIYWFKQL